MLSVFHLHAAKLQLTERASQTLYYIQKYSQVVAYSGKSARMFKRQACGDGQRDLVPFLDIGVSLTLALDRRSRKLSRAGDAACRGLARRHSDGSSKHLCLAALIRARFELFSPPQVRYDDVGRDKLMALLREHITTNLVKVGSMVFSLADLASSILTFRLSC